MVNLNNATKKNTFSLQVFFALFLNVFLLKKKMVYFGNWHFDMKPNFPQLFFWRCIYKKIHQIWVIIKKIPHIAKIKRLFVGWIVKFLLWIVKTFQNCSHNQEIKRLSSSLIFSIPSIFQKFLEICNFFQFNIW